MNWKKGFITALLLLTASFGGAFAQSSLSFAVDDKDFTYFGSKTGYLSLSLEDEKLVLHIDDEPTAMKLTFDKIKAPSYGDYSGRTRTWSEADYEKDPYKRGVLRRLAGCDVSFSRATVRHPYSRMASTIGTYEEALRALGFETTDHTVHGKVRDYTFERGDQRLQLSFHRSFDGKRSVVQVDMKAI